MYTPN